MEKTNKRKKHQEKEEIITKEAPNYLEDLKRIQADFENYIKRSYKEKEEIITKTKYNLIKNLLPIIDDFEIALSSIKKTSENEETILGVNLIFKRLWKLLEDEGVKQIEALEKKYDPYTHEVIKKIDSDKEEGTIIEEIQKGYLFNENLLRSTKVIISNGKKEVPIKINIDTEVTQND